MIGRGGIEYLRQPLGVGAVEFDPHCAARVESTRGFETTGLGGAEFLQRPDRSAGIGANLIDPGLLAVEFLDDDQR
jgi:hypothetical protein